MLGKMSTTMRCAERKPISMMSIPAMAMVYGRRSARRTRPIIYSKIPRTPRLLDSATLVSGPLPKAAETPAA